MEKNPHAAIDIEVRGNASIEIENLAAHLHKELESLQPLSAESNSIYRVPKRLRELNEKAYTPQVVAIGPLHYGMDKLRPMEEHKRRYLHDFLQRNKANSLVDYFNIIKAHEEKLRKSYAEDIKLSSDEFVKMVLIDAAFIIEVLMKSKFSNPQSENDRIFTKPWMIADVMFDMCLLENQLPFFILDDLFQAVSIFGTDDDKKDAIIKLIHDFTKESWDFSEIEENRGSRRFDKVEHLVDFLSICLAPQELNGPRKMKLGTLTTPTVTELHQAGVKFKEASNKSFFAIEFDSGSGILRIPHLKIVKETELLFRNLLAFEQCHGSSNCINDFIVLINHLVNSPKDVDLLIQFGIIENWLWDSSGVSTLFHSLVKETTIIPEKFYFSGIVDDMNRYCRTPWHRWKATLKQDYFRNPWAGISVFAAIVLLALTFVQTVSSVIKK